MRDDRRGRAAAIAAEALVRPGLEGFAAGQQFVVATGHLPAFGSLGVCGDVGEGTSSVQGFRGAHVESARLALMPTALRNADAGDVRRPAGRRW